MKILFVDDVRDVREMFRLGLEVAGHQVVTADSGSEAVSYLAQESFDAVVLDVEMPKMNGWQTLLKIRELPQNNLVPVFLLTAYHESTLEAAAVQVEVAGCFHKPILPDMLMRKIEEYVRGRDATGI